MSTPQRQKWERVLFGIFRAVLAIFVLICHVCHVNQIGQYSVYAFFCLTGFLMTMLVCGPYAGRPMAFFVNRFLRIYPMYWAIFLATVAWIVWRVPGMIGGDGLMGVPTDWPSILRQIAFVVRPSDKLTVVLVAWAVSEEVFFYVLIGLGIFRTQRRATISLVVSVACLAFEWWQGYSVPDAYYSPLTAAFAFALGGWLFHANQRWRAALSVEQWAALLCGSIVATTYLQAALLTNGLSGHLAGTAPILLNTVGVGALVVLLFNCHPSAAMRRWDDAIGSISYPLYLSHFLGIGIVRSTPPYLLDGPAAELADCVVSIAIAVALVLVVDHPIQTLRARIRAGIKLPRHTALSNG